MLCVVMEFIFVCCYVLMLLIIFFAVFSELESYVSSYGFLFVNDTMFFRIILIGGENVFLYSEFMIFMM